MAGGTGGMTNVPGSKPMLVPPGAQVQLAHPWAANQPAWATSPPYTPPVSPLPQDGDGAWRPPGGVNDVGNARPRVERDKPSWQAPMSPAGILSPMMLPGLQAQLASRTPQPNPGSGTPVSGGGTAVALGTPAQPQRTPQQDMAELLALISGGYNAM